MASYYIGGFNEEKKEDILAVVGDQELKNTDPYLKPVPISNNGIINIIKDFSWFSGGSTAALAGLDRTPFAVFREREQKLNSTLSQAIYYMNAIASGAQDAANTVTSTFGESIGLSKSDAAGATDQIAKFTEKLNTAGATDNQLLKANKLASLAGLYVTEPTGFNYVFPYFESPPDVSSNWSDQARTGGIESVLSTGFDIVDEVTSFVNIAQPGVYIQKPKFFQHDSNGPQITITFPLFNTVKRSQKTPYQQNYELLWLLAYQNKTFKTSFGRSKPPKIYSVTIPGVANMPYAYISNLSIDFVGTTRNMQVDIADKSVKTPIPEAYNVSVTVQSLLSDYANLMLGAGFYTDTANNSATIQT